MYRGAEGGCTGVHRGYTGGAQGDTEGHRGAGSTPILAKLATTTTREGVKRGLALRKAERYASRPSKLEMLVASKMSMAKEAEA